MANTLYTLNQMLSPNGVLGDNTIGDVSAQDMRDVVWSLYNISGSGSGSVGPTVSNDQDLQSVLNNGSSATVTTNLAINTGIHSTLLNSNNVSLQITEDNATINVVGFSRIIGAGGYKLLNADSKGIHLTTNDLILDYGNSSITLLNNTLELSNGTSSVTLDDNSMIISATGGMFYTLQSYTDDPRWITDKEYVDNEIALQIATFSSTFGLQEVLDNSATASTLNRTAIYSPSDINGNNSTLLIGTQDTYYTVTQLANISNNSISYVTSNDNFSGFANVYDTGSANINNILGIARDSDESNVSNSLINKAANTKLYTKSSNGANTNYNSISLLSDINSTNNSLVIIKSIDDDIQSINFSEFNINITDDITSVGLVYNADYSTNGLSNPLWIPDLQTVDARIADNAYFGGTGVSLTGYTFSTDASIIPTTQIIGTSATGSSIQDVLINIDNLLSDGIASDLQSVLDIGSTATIPTQFNVISDESSLIFGSGYHSLQTDNGLTSSSYFSGNSLYTRVGYNYLSSESYIDISSSIMVVLDDVNSTGLIYASDYSVNGELNDNWIPNWGTVKSYTSNNTVIAGDSLDYVNNGLTLSVIIDPNSASFLESTSTGLKLNSLQINNTYVDNTVIYGTTPIVDLQIDVRLDYWAGLTANSELSIGDVVIFTDVNNIDLGVGTYSTFYMRATTASSDHDDFVYINNPNPSDAYIKSLFSANNGIVYTTSTGLFEIDPAIAGNGIVFTNGVLSIDSSLSIQSLQDVIEVDGIVLNATNDISILYDVSNTTRSLYMSAATFSVGTTYVLNGAFMNIIIDSNINSGGLSFESKKQSGGTKTEIGFKSGLISTDNTFGVISDLTIYNNGLIDSSYVTKKWVSDNFAGGSEITGYYAGNGLELDAATFSIGGTMSDDISLNGTHSFTLSVEQFHILNESTGYDYMLITDGSVEIGDTQATFNLYGANIEMSGSSDIILSLNQTTNTFDISIDNNKKISYSKSLNNMANGQFNNALDYDGGTFNSSSSDIPGIGGFRVSEFMTLGNTSDSIENEIAINSNGDKLNIASNEFFGYEIYILGVDIVSSKSAYYKIGGLVNGFNGNQVSNTYEVLGNEFGTEQWEVDVRFVGSPNRLGIFVNGMNDNVTWSINGRITINGGNNI